MIKVIVIFLLTVLNIGMYLLLVRPVQLNFSRTYILVGSFVYAILAGAFLMHEAYVDLIKISLYLFAADVLTFILLQFILPAIRRGDAMTVTFVKRFFQYLLIPILTLMVTAWQYNYLFDAR